MTRPILKNVFNQKPNFPLYHYTDQSGLLGIIDKKEIWATHTQYLNDTQEFKHACKLVADEIERRLRLPAKKPLGVYETGPKA